MKIEQFAREYLGIVLKPWQLKYLRYLKWLENYNKNIYSKHNS